MENYVNLNTSRILMNDKLTKLQHIFKLKEIERSGKVLERKESTAEHTWSSMMLAEYFLKQMSHDLDELKVLKLILYHDVVEIEAGDVHIVNQTPEKAEKEQQAFEKLKDLIPIELKDEYSEYFHEYENRTSKEAKFAKAIDALEPMIHWLNDKPAWKASGFTEENLKEFKEKHLVEFPELMDFYKRLIEYLKQEDYIYEFLTSS